MKALISVLLLPFLAPASCGDRKEESVSQRYTTNSFTVAGGMAVVTEITDHKENKIYHYKVAVKNGITSRKVIDLTESGSKDIPFGDM